MNRQLSQEPRLKTKCAKAPERIGTKVIETKLKLANVCLVNPFTFNIYNYIY